MVVGRVALADPGGHKASSHRSVPATVTRSAPDITGAIAPAKGQPQPAAVDDGVLPPPFTLPKASRNRMRACGHKWESLKEAGATGDDIWRDFASKCLAAKADPVMAPVGAREPTSSRP